MKAGLVVLLGILWPTASFAIPLPDCAGALKIPAAHVVRVEKDGALVLAQGENVLLEGIRLASADDPSAGVGARVLAQLRVLTTKAPLALTSSPPERDRYGRLRVQAFGSVWIQVALLKAGLARVDIAPDRDECAPDLYDAEAEARRAGRGVWSLPAYGVKDAGKLSLSSAGRFEVVEGKIQNVSVHDGRAFLDFVQDFRHGFSAIVQPEDRKAFKNAPFALEDLVDRTVRVRGIVENFNGKPEIALSNPYQIEVLD